MMKPQYRNMVEPGAPFGTEVSATPGADDWERLAAFMGHDPRTTLGSIRGERVAGPSHRLGVLSLGNSPR